MKRKDIIKGCQVKITTHAVQRYLERAENISYENFYKMLEKAKNGDKQAAQRINKTKKELESKFRNTGLKKFLKDGTEMRYELSGNMNQRCTFVAIKKGNQFIVKTAYLQGKKNNFWKVG